MLFQTIDVKDGCKNFYIQNKFVEDLNGFKNQNLLTWKKTPSVCGTDVDYAWLMSGGKEIEDLKVDILLEAKSRLQAWHKSFITAKVDLQDNCFFDLIPENILVDYYEKLNAVCQDLDENFERTELYRHLKGCHELLESISDNPANINMNSFKKSISSKNDIQLLKRLADKKYICYNLFGTKTGRLTTKKSSFPILTLAKKFRKCIEPNNDLLLEFDLNSAEARTFLNLIDFELDEDIHTYNANNVFKGSSRDEAKIKFFSWLYDLKKTDKQLDSAYDRKRIIEDFYLDGKIQTLFGREIPCTREKVINYCLQSMTNDVVLEGAVRIRDLLKGRKSRIYFLLHDSIVLDFCKEDKDLILDIIDIFKNTKIGEYVLNMRVGTNFGEMREIIV